MMTIQEMYRNEYAVNEDDSVEVIELKKKISELEAENRALCRNIADISRPVYLGKQDVMEKFQVGSDWALRLLRLMNQVGLATKIGRCYYALETDVVEFFNIYKGKALYI